MAGDGWMDRPAWYRDIVAGLLRISPGERLGVRDAVRVLREAYKEAVTEAGASLGAGERVGPSSATGMQATSESGLLDPASTSAASDTPPASEALSDGPERATDRVASTSASSRPREVDLVRLLGSDKGEQADSAADFPSGTKEAPVRRTTDHGLIDSVVSNAPPDSPGGYPSRHERVSTGIGSGYSGAAIASMALEYSDSTLLGHDKRIMHEIDDNDDDAPSPRGR